MCADASRAFDELDEGIEEDQRREWEQVEQEGKAGRYTNHSAMDLYDVRMARGS